MEIAAKEESPVVAVHTAQVAAAVVEDHHMLALNAHLPNLLCIWNTSSVEAPIFEKSRKARGMLNAIPLMCFRGLTTIAAHRGMSLHLEASSWRIQAGQILGVVARVAQASQASAQAALAAEGSQLLAVAVL